MKYISLLFFLYVGCLHAQSQEINKTEEKNISPSKAYNNQNNAPATNSEMMENKSIDTIAAPMTAGSKKKALAKDLKEESVSTGTSSLFITNSANYKRVYQQSTKNNFSRSATPAQETQMNTSLNYMNTIAPESFESNLFNYVNSRYDSDSAEYLLKAAELRPNDQLLRKQLNGYYIVEQDYEKADSITETFYNDGTYCEDMKVYANSLSSSVSQSNTIIVHGIDDLLPLSQVKNEANKSYDIVSLELLQSKDYRKQLTAEGYSIPKSKVVDTAFLAEFVRLNPEKKIQLSMTLPKEYLQHFVPNLYPQGLTFVLTKNDDLDKFNAELWEKEWDRSKLLNGSNDQCDNLNKNYLPALYTLLNYYSNIGKHEEANKILEVINAISKRNGMTTKPIGKRGY